MLPQLRDYFRVPRLAAVLCILHSMEVIVGHAMEGNKIALHLTEHSGRGTVLCDKGLLHCKASANMMFWVETPKPFDTLIGGASFSINDGPIQVRIGSEKAPFFMIAWIYPQG